MAEQDGSVPRMIGDRYETEHLIGRGGMGSVWLAQDTLLGRRVAIKEIGALPGEIEGETERALREARSAAALNHPNVVALYDAIEHDGTPWLVMEYVAGPTLSEWVREHGPMDPEAAAEVGARLASGLAAAHRAGIVHRDIKPANVFMADDGEPKIGDFGTARGGSDDRLTLAGVVTGTPSYMAPEVADGGDHADAADVWGLGATLYFAVEGADAYPGAGNALATLRTIATRPPRTPVRSGALEPILAQMLAHSASRRGTMHDTRRRLEAIAPGRAGAIPMVGAGAGAVTAAEDEQTNAHFVSREIDEGAGLLGFAGAHPRQGSDTPARKGVGRRGQVAAGLVAAVLVGGIGVAAFTGGGDEEREATPPTSTTTTTERSSGSPTPSTSTRTRTSPTPETAPAPRPTTGADPEPRTEAPRPEATSNPPSPESTLTPERTESTTESSPETTAPSPEPTSETTEPTAEPPSDPEPQPTDPTTQPETPPEQEPSAPNETGTTD